MDKDPYKRHQRDRYRETNGERERRETEGKEKRRSILTSSISFTMEESASRKEGR